VPDGGSTIVRLPGRWEIAIFRRGESFIAIENRCPHEGGPLAEGPIERGMLICPWHRFRFYLGTGASVTNPAMRARTFKAFADGDQVALVLPT